jgi:hypothetical protein
VPVNATDLDSCSVGNGPECEADHSSSTFSEVENAWSNMLTHKFIFHGVVVSTTDIFTFHRIYCSLGIPSHSISSWKFLNCFHYMKSSFCEMDMFLILIC